MSDDFKHRSEIKFVQWSKGTNTGSFDVTFVAGKLAQIRSRPILGLDVGGGIGTYASALCELLGDASVTVVDKSKLAATDFVDDPRCVLQSVDFDEFTGDIKYDFVVFKTVLHHFVDHVDSGTYSSQLRALRKAHGLLKDEGTLIVQEDFYDGILGTDWTGRLIFEITKVKGIERLTRRLGANTAGEGVRFRSYRSWLDLFSGAGFHVQWVEKVPHWGNQWPYWQRLPLMARRRYEAIVGLEKTGLRRSSQ